MTTDELIRHRAAFRASMAVHDQRIANLGALTMTRDQLRDLWIMDAVDRAILTGDEPRFGRLR